MFSEDDCAVFIVIGEIGTRGEVCISASNMGLNSKMKVKFVENNS